MSGRFEGSFLGDVSRLHPDARLECKICWHVYDPKEGDEMRQIPPNTPFAQLPEDWRCPQCDGERNQFMVLNDGEVHETAISKDEMARDLAKQFKTIFTEVHKTKMQDMPFTNRSIHVDTIGFKPLGERFIGVLITPWCMNLVLCAAPNEDWSKYKIGDKRVVNFPSGEYEFIYNHRENVGGYFACSLFSPMEEFQSQLQATDTARAIIVELFAEENREENDRGAEIKELREKDINDKELAKAEVEKLETPKTANPAPSRRALFTGGGGENSQTQSEL